MKVRAKNSYHYILSFVHTFTFVIFSFTLIAASGAAIDDVTI